MIGVQPTNAKLRDRARDVIRRGHRAVRGHRRRRSRPPATTCRSPASCSRRGVGRDEAARLLSSAGSLRGLARPPDDERPALRAAIVPPAMKARVETLAAENVEVRTLRYILGEPKIYEWAHSIGACTDPVLESLVPPFPPRELRLLVAEPEIELFLWTGILDLDRRAAGVRVAWRGSRAEARDPRLRLRLRPAAPIPRPVRGLADLHGAGRQPRARRVVPGATCPGSPRGDGASSPRCPHGRAVRPRLLALGPHPPPRGGDRPVARELARVIRPGGLLVATTHGARGPLERAERERGASQRVVGLRARRASPVCARRSSGRGAGELCSPAEQSGSRRRIRGCSSRRGPCAVGRTSSWRQIAAVRPSGHGVPTSAAARTQRALRRPARSPGVPRHACRRCGRCEAHVLVAERRAAALRACIRGAGRAGRCSCAQRAASPVNRNGTDRRPTRFPRMLSVNSVSRS